MIYVTATTDYYNKKSDIKTTSIESLLSFISSNKLLCLDIETCFSYTKDRVYKATKKSLSELNCFDNKILLIQIGNLDTQYIIDIRYTNQDDVLSALNLIISKKIKIVGHNLFYDLHWIRAKYNVVIENIHDTFLVEKIITNGKFEAISGVYGLADLYNRYYNININTTQLSLFEPRASKKVRDQFPAITNEELSITHLTYARYDVIYPIRIYNIQIKNPDYLAAKKLVNMEHAYLQVLIDMKINGVDFDITTWEKALEESSKALIEVKGELLKLNEINWNSPQQKLEYYEKQLGIKLEDRKGKASSGMEALKLIAETLEEDTTAWTVTDLLLNYGKLSKQVNAYGSKFLRYINKSTGRIHPTVNQMMITGRTSSSNPNGQNIPRSNAYRNAFFLPEGFSICDYSSMEVRRVAELANETTLINNLNSGNDPHAESAEKIFGLEFMQKLYSEGVDRGNNKYRSIGKTLNFSMILI